MHTATESTLWELSAVDFIFCGLKPLIKMQIAKCKAFFEIKIAVSFM